MRALPSNELRVYYVWVPAIASDSLEAARRAAARFSDPRAEHFFDDGGRLGMSLGKALGLPGRIGHPEEAGLGWDVFLLYDGTALWREEPPAPAYWMHQLMSVALEHAEFFDPGKLRARTEAMLGEGPRTHGPSPAQPTARTR